jgi:2-polyprenyl-6-hydroxyphenyl methylase/3-demethylubiquinone-9 3-methyltransferase
MRHKTGLVTPFLTISACDLDDAFSSQIATDDQVETDRQREVVVGSGGLESVCGR